MKIVLRNKMVAQLLGSWPSDLYPWAVRIGKRTCIFDVQLHTINTALHFGLRYQKHGIPARGRVGLSAGPEN